MDAMDANRLWLQKQYNILQINKIMGYICVKLWIIFNKSCVIRGIMCIETLMFCRNKPLKADSRPLNYLPGFIFGVRTDCSTLSLNTALLQIALSTVFIGRVKLA